MEKKDANNKEFREILSDDNKISQSMFSDPSEKKRMAREERRRQKNLEKAAAESEAGDAKSHESRPKKPIIDRKKPPINKKKVFLCVAGAIFIALLAVLWNPISNYINEAGRDHSRDNYLVLPDVTGYTEEDGMEMLRESGFVNIKKEYIYDHYTQDECIVKTNEHIRAQLRPDEEIIVYICDKTLINMDNPNMEHDGEQLPNNTYFTLNNMSIIDMAVKDDIFYAMIRNDSSKAMKNIVYIIGYQDESGYKVGENRYNLSSDMTILPGEKFFVSGDISKVTAAYLYVSGISCDYIDVPSEQRK